MLIVMHTKATTAEIDAVCQYLENKSLKSEKLPGSNRVAIGVTGNKKAVSHDQIARMQGVKEIIYVTHKYKKVSREFYPENTIVNVGQAAFGSGTNVIIAGPCSIESKEQILASAKHVKASGAQILRGGAFKPRTSPYDFQGLGREGLDLIHQAGQEVGIPICVEIMSIKDIDLYAQKCDMIQVGARNMQNFDLLKALGKLNTPILLKRGMSALVEEFLLAAEYILDGGNKNVVLCERGIRTFETSTRNILDLNAVALIKKMSHLPIIVDPSHATGRHDLVLPLAKAGLAVGADGIIVETHPKPMEALSDANQQLDFKQFTQFMESINSNKPKY